MPLSSKTTGNAAPKTATYHEILYRDEKIKRRNTSVIGKMVTGVKYASLMTSIG